MTGSPLAAFPLDPKLDPDVDFARRPFSTQETFPSVIGSGGRVGWSKFRTDRDDWVSISYPDIKYVPSSATLSILYLTPAAGID
jgi:hypothetical protein